LPRFRWPFDLVVREFCGSQVTGSTD